MDPEPTKTIFRTWRNTGDVIALFPEIPGDIRGFFCASYMHVGQHGAATPLIVGDTCPSTPAEIAELKVELERSGYRVQVAKRFTQRCLETRRKALHEMTTS